MKKEEYEEILKKHIRHVAIIGLSVAKKFYPEVNKNNLTKYLIKHENVKFKYSNELAELYGTNGAKLKQIEAVIAQEEKELKIIGKTNPIFQDIEMIADFVDRGLNPDTQKEFKRAMVRASDILTGKNREIALWAEKNYDKIIKLKITSFK